MLKNATKAGGNAQTIIAPASDTSASVSHPTCYRLPKSGGGDPFFNLSRSFYYEGEKRAYWRLIRLKERGKLRGVTLVPYDQVSAFVLKQMKEGAGA